jgi:hypothetical protein
MMTSKANKYIMPDGDIDTEAYLKDNNYRSVEEWAFDSDYEYNKHQDYWYDTEGHIVDIDMQLWYVIDSLIGE